LHTKKYPGGASNPLNPSLIASLTAQTTQIVKFLLSNVAFRQTEYKTGMPEQKTIEINTIA
jgi:hypothetical protein